MISNAAAGSAQIDLNLINHHETVHIFQERLFGPLFQVTYVVWAVGGFFYALGYMLINWEDDWKPLMETAMYYDNPFEYWAYNSQGFWPPSTASNFDPSIAWN